MATRDEERPGQAYHYATSVQPSVPQTSSTRDLHKSQEQNHMPLKRNKQKQTLDQL